MDISGDSVGTTNPGGLEAWRYLHTSVLPHTHGVEMSDFEKAIENVLQNEGGVSSQAADKGGATNFGITQGLLDKVRPGVSVSNMTIEGAKFIYQEVFWNPLKLDQVGQIPATC